MFVSIGLLSSLFCQLGNLVGEPRDFPARTVLVNDVALCCAHQLRLGLCHRLQCRGAVATLDRRFDHADGATHLGTARLVDSGATGNLAPSLAGASRTSSTPHTP